MSAPNEFIPPTSHAFHHENVAPLVIQAAHSNSNYVPAPTNGGHFNGSGFFPNSIGYDVAMLPFLHHTSQRPAHFNAFAHQKQTPDMSKEDIAPSDGRANVFNTETTSPSAIQSAYWSRQSQLSPFGVLPHEISPDHIEPEAKPTYDAINPHFQHNLPNHLPPNECLVDHDKKTQVIVSGKTKDVKKFIPKPSNEMKMPIPVDNYNQNDMIYRNGVINHGGHNVKVNSAYKPAAKPIIDVEPLPVVNEPMNTVPRDYRVFKSPALFPNSSVPVVKFTGKPTKPYVQKQLMKPPPSGSPVLKNRMNGSPSLIHKMPDFHEDSQSSPISLTSDDIREYSTDVPTIKENGEYPMPISNTIPYRDQIPDISCQDKTKVTQPFTKLPYSGVNNSPNVDRRTSFPPLYIMYNNPPAPAPAPAPMKRPEKPNERVDKMIPHTSDMIPKPQNGLVGYSSVIMRTDRTYETEEKLDKSPRRMLWNERQLPNVAAKNDKIVYKDTHNHAPPVSDHLLLGLTERQHSYFDNSPAQQITQPMANVKCPPKNVHEVAPQESVHHYQYMPINKPVPPIEEEKYPRKRKTSKNEYTRDPPPAHVNLYQQPVQNTGYMMDNNRYDVNHTMPKMYPNNDQFYPQPVNNYMNVSHEPQHQTVISTNTTRLSPSNTHRNVPTVPTLPLSAYFSSFHSTSHYSPEYSAEYLPNDQYQQNKSQKEVYDGRSKVVVPNIEEEFKFLFDPSTPNFKQIAHNEEYQKPVAKPMFYRKNIDFLASYIKFLENNCESVETLTDSNSSTIKTWNRNKVVYQPIVREEPAEIPKEPPKAKEPETNFENDPRYYPLPKSSDKRRLDSSSDESSDEFDKPFGRKDDRKKSKKDLRSDKKHKKKNSKKEPKEEASVKTKLEKLEKAKQKVAKLQLKAEIKKHKADKIKPKMEKALAEIRAIKQSGLVPKPKPTVQEQKTVQRRKVSDRKAKDEVLFKQRIQQAIDSEEESHTDSDSDPSWTPRADDDEGSSKRKSARIRSIRFSSKTSRKSDIGSFKQNYTSYGKKETSNSQSAHGTKESSKNSKVLEDNHKLKPFFILKKDAKTKHPSIWRLQDESRLQKFEYGDNDGRHLYRSTTEFIKYSDNDKSKYQEVEVTLIEEKNDKVLVELCDDTEIPTDLKIKENFMKESLCYEHQFAVYIQTLVSQALDSNFLSEIVKENDVYFLNNMKVIDEVTATYLSDLTGVVKWHDSPIDVLVKTWPFISIKNIRTETTKSNAKCFSCNENNAKQTAIFYGQPYQRETLQGCKTNSTILSDMDKTADLCKNCAREVKLFNKIWHQKYHVFIECAKYVSKKKSEDRTKGTTDILNELLADTAWLSRLFYDIRNTWLQIWTIVQKCKES